LFTLAAGSVLALGQTNPLAPTNLTIRVGGGFGIDQSLNQSASGFYGFGMDFGFGHGFFPNAVTYYSGDILWGARKSMGQSLIPVFINQRFYQDKGNGDQNIGQDRLYFNIGLGATYYEIGGSDIKPAGKVGIGMEFNETLCGEADLFVAQESKENVSANLVAFYLGYRF
jgi:hypothetical protein